MQYPSHNSNYNQQGVTLLLSILVLAAITAISFSLAAIVFVEIRTSGDQQRTEPAVYSTISVLEEAIYQVQRDKDQTYLCYPPRSCPVQIKSNINTVNISDVKVNNVNDSPITERVAMASNTVSNTKNVYDIYDDQNPNDPKYGYSRIRIVNRSTVQLRYTYCQVNDNNVNPSDCVPPIPWLDCSQNLNTSGMSSAWIDRDVVLMPGAEREFNPSINKVYKLYVYQRCNSVTPADIEVYSYGPLSSTDACITNVSACPLKGLPLKGQRRVDVTATNAGLTRRYRVFTPLAR